MRTEGNTAGIKGPLLILAVLLVGLVAIKLVGFGDSDPAPAAQAPTPVRDAALDRARITLSTTSLDFGMLVLADSAVRQVVMRNDGDSAVRLVLSAPKTYRLTNSELTLEPGESKTVSVTASPAVPGLLRDQLRIASSGESGDVLVVALEGRVKDGGAVARVGIPGGAKGRPVERPDAETVEVARALDRSPSGPTGPGVVSRPPASPRVAAGATPSTGSGGGRGADVVPTAASPAPDTPRGRASGRVKPFDPTTSTPIQSLVDPVGAVSREISAEERANARPLPEQAPDGDDPEQIPPDLEQDGNDPFEDPFDDHDDDPFDDDADDADDADNEPDDPFDSPALAISGFSTVTLLGATVQFYPQSIDVLGADMGGVLQLVQPIRFPSVALAFGESLAFAQNGPVTGNFDPGAGQVSLHVPVTLVDSDGDAAPLMLALTTGTTVGRNDAGIVVSLTGNARDPGSGFLKLVGIGKVPVGFNNGAEDHLVAVEVLATLTFATSIAGGT